MRLQQHLTILRKTLALWRVERKLAGKYRALGQLTAKQARKKRLDEENLGRVLPEVLHLEEQAELLRRYLRETVLADAPTPEVTGPPGRQA